MVINKNKTDRLQINLPKELTKEIDAYVSLDEKLKSRSKGIRFLVEKGLASEYRKSKQLRLDIKQILDEENTNKID